MPDVAVQVDTIEEVLRTGHDLLALCANVPAASAPKGFFHAAIEVKVMLNELAEAVHEQ